MPRAEVQAFPSPFSCSFPTDCSAYACGARVASPLCRVFDNHWPEEPYPKRDHPKGPFFDAPELVRCVAPLSFPARVLTLRPTVSLHRDQAEDILNAHGFEVVSSLEKGVASVKIVRSDGKSMDEYLRELDAAKERRAQLAANARPAPPTAVDCVSVTDVATRAFVTREPLAQLGNPSRDFRETGSRAGRGHADVDGSGLHGTGKAMVAGDFNNDGQSDLAVGAPFYIGERGNAQRGSVFVVNSAGVAGAAPKSAAPAVEEIEAEASLRLVGPEPHGRFGMGRHFKKGVGWVGVGRGGQQGCGGIGWMSRFDGTVSSAQQKGSKCYSRIHEPDPCLRTPNPDPQSMPPNHEL